MPLLGQEESSDSLGQCCFCFVLTVKCHYFRGLSRNFPYTSPKSFLTQLLRCTLKLYYSSCHMSESILLLTDRKCTLQSPKSHFKKTSHSTYKLLTCLLHNISDKSLPLYHADNYIYAEVVNIFYFIYFLQSN